MPSVFDVLAQDHAEVKRMLAELELGPTAATGADADQLALRKRMVQQLVIEVSKHEAVEEMYFWPAVRSHVTDGTDLANQAQGQEQEGKEVLARLDKLAPEDEAFEVRLSQFITAGRAHIAFEDIRYFAVEVLQHRILLNYDGQAENVAVPELIQKCLQQLTEDA